VQGGVESLMYIGFKNIFLMGDHGGGQQEMRQVSEEMTTKFAAKGIKVHYVGDFYQKTHDDIDMYMYEHKLPIAGHGGMMETAEMMYWEPTQYAFIRPIYKTVPFDGRGSREIRWRRISRPGRTEKMRARLGPQALAPQLPVVARRAGAVVALAVAEAAPQVPRLLRASTTVSAATHTLRPRKSGKDLAEIGINNTVNQVRKLLAGG
jgi:hypothetical protein